ncbi:MAG: nucleoside monophosphate kinase [bacterium]
MQGQTYVFFGMTGSGKGTQVKLLMEYLKDRGASDMVYVYPGDEYRKLLDAGTYTASILHEYVPKGRLVPGFMTDAIVANILIASLKKDSILITDGYPRALEQSRNFEEMVNFYERKDVEIVYIEISKEEAVRRMKLRGRHDDTDEGIATRFDEYVKNVVPSMDYFNNNGNYKIRTVNGEQSPEDVHKEIISALRI